MTSPYRPSNGTEGEAFMAQFCDQCAKDRPADGCSIIAKTMAIDVDDPDYPKEWTHDEAGRPMCSAFMSVDDHKRPRAPRCKHTVDMFGGDQ